MEVLESTAEIIPTIGPLFSTIVSAVLGLAKTLQVRLPIYILHGPLTHPCG